MIVYYSYCIHTYIAMFGIVIDLKYFKIPALAI